MKRELHKKMARGKKKEKTVKKDSIRRKKKEL